MTTLKIKNPRYKYKFTNGYWKTFDTEEYTDVELHLLKKDAIFNVKKLNENLNGK